MGCVRSVAVLNRIESAVNIAGLLHQLARDKHPQVMVVFVIMIMMRSIVGGINKGLVSVWVVTVMVVVMVMVMMNQVTMMIDRLTYCPEVMTMHTAIKSRLADSDGEGDDVHW